jgi:glycosyltransferase involved in cell wall biosynthesis
MRCESLTDAEREAGMGTFLATSPCAMASCIACVPDSDLGRRATPGEVIVVGAARDCAAQRRGPSEMTRTTKPIRVMHVVRSTYGTAFSGTTHRFFSLLSGWRDGTVRFDLWGTTVRPLNMNSGNLEYRLRGSLWSGAGKQGRWRRILETLRVPALATLEAGRFDIAHFHHSNWGVLASPVILHLLGRKAVCHMTLFGSDNPSFLARLRGGRFALALLGQFDGIVTVSPRLADDCVKHGLRNVICLPNFLALRQLEPGRDAAAGERTRRELAIPLEATVLLFVGSVIRRKGVDLLAESFARLASRHHDLWLVTVGPNSRAESPAIIDDEFVRAARERIDLAGAAPRVVWAGTVRDKNVLSQYYSAADIFVLPTRAEGLGNVLIEAAAAGVPAVATNLPGVTDSVVVDGETGFLFPPGDVDALTQAIERLVTDSALRARMGQAARVQSKRFGFEEYCRQLKAFYLKVAGR